jgi:hypothetical protein
MLAAYHGHEAIVEALLARGARVNARHTEEGSTALQMAARQGLGAIVAALLARGAEVNATSNTGQVPLHVAADGGHHAVVRDLLDAGADIDLKDHAGVSALMYAVAKGRSAVAELLVARGALDTGTLALQRGYQLARGNSHAEALPHLRRALEGRKQNPEASAWYFAVQGWQYQTPNPQITLLALLGECHAKCGQAKEARERFAACLEAWPRGQKSLTLYGRVRDRPGEVTDESYELGLAALREQARDPAAAGTLHVRYVIEQYSPGRRDRRTGGGTVRGLMH